MWTFFGTLIIFDDFFKESGRNILPWWQTRKKKKKRTQQRTPTKCESGRAGYRQKSYKQDHGGQIIR